MFSNTSKITSFRQTMQTHEISFLVLFVTKKGLPQIEKHRPITTYCYCYNSTSTSDRTDLGKINFNKIKLEFIILPFCVF